MLGDSGGGGESEEDLVEVKGTDPLFSAMAERAGGSEGDGEGEGEGEQAGAMDPSASLGSLVRQLEQTLPGDWNPTSSSPVPTTDHPLAFEPSSPPRSSPPAALTSYGELLPPPSYASVAPPPYTDLPPPPPYADVPPPSYADSMFLGGEIEQAGVDDNIALSAANIGQTSASKAKGQLSVQVSDPIKRDDGSSALAMVGKKYVEYLVTTSTNLPGFNSCQFSVRRRFRDFVTLAEVLADSHRGYFIPQRPEKTLMEGQMSADKEFVEERRMQLERYLAALAAHPVLRHSAELRTFLESEAGFSTCPTVRDSEGSYMSSAARLPKQMFGHEPAVPNLAEVSQPTRASRDFLRVFKELKQAVVQSPVMGALGGAVGAAPQSAPSLEDDAFLTHKVAAELVDRDRHLMEASRKAEQLVLRQTAHGDVVGELGMSLIKLANHEDKEGQRLGHYSAQGHQLLGVAHSTRSLGRAAVRLARLSRAASSQTVDRLLPLHQYLGLNAAVRKALHDRSQALLTAQTLEAEAKAKSARLSKLDEQKSRVFGAQEKHQKRVDDLAREIQACEASQRAAVAEYERIKSRNLDEWERLTNERQHDFSLMLSGVARVQAAHAERAASVWLAVAKEFGASVENCPGLAVLDNSYASTPQSSTRHE
mmetsp:Transcript_7789/g.14719  ORF Transcript_7789/g.14719 Transcript_7789/m.14719 type:complete len:651 (-) Transcript_7789:276-2228(-)